MHRSGTTDTTDTESEAAMITLAPAGRQPEAILFSNNHGFNLQAPGFRRVP